MESNLLGLKWPILVFLVQGHVMYVYTTFCLIYADNFNLFIFWHTEKTQPLFLANTNTNICERNTLMKWILKVWTLNPMKVNCGLDKNIISLEYNIYLHELNFRFRECASFILVLIASMTSGQILGDLLTFQVA